MTLTDVSTTWAEVIIRVRVYSSIRESCRKWTWQMSFVSKINILKKTDKFVLICTFSKYKLYLAKFLTSIPYNFIDLRPLLRRDFLGRFMDSTVLKHDQVITRLLTTRWARFVHPRSARINFWWTNFCQPSHSTSSENSFLELFVKIMFINSVGRYFKR